jgi:transcriptional regulator with XRE-family HTH domain
MSDVESTETFGEAIKRLRLARNLSQERLEALVNYTPGNGMVSQIENGERGKRMSPSRMAAFAQALGVPVAEIMRAAGRLTKAEAATLKQRPSFEAFVNSDPELRVDQKRMLVLLYKSYVPGSSSSKSAGG